MTKSRRKKKTKSNKNIELPVLNESQQLTPKLEEKGLKGLIWFGVIVIAVIVIVIAVIIIASPRSSIISLLSILFPCIATILGLMLTYRWKESSMLEKIILIMGIVSTLVVALNNYNRSTKESRIERINEKFGDLSDDYDAFVPTFQIRNSGTRFLVTKGVFIYDKSGPLIKGYIKNNRLCIYVIIRDQEGDPIAVIEDNTWYLYNDDFEYNNDDKGYELVTKGDRRVYFQIELNDGIAYFAGLLYTSQHEGIYFMHSGESNGASITYIRPDSRLNLNAILNPLVKPIFKYPREKYFERRVE